MAKKKKTKSISTSKKKKTKRYPGQEPSWKVIKTKLPPEGESDTDFDDGTPATEADPLLDDVTEAFKDFTPGEHAHVKYPSPRPKDVEFTRYWKEFVGAVTGRENFKTSHLHQLITLCDLYVEYGELRTFLRKHGYTYEAFGRQGKAIKPYPEVAQLNKIRTEIRNYSKMLGLLLTKDKDPTSGGEGSNWE